MPTPRPPPPRDLGNEITTFLKGNDKEIKTLTLPNIETINSIIKNILKSNYSYDDIFAQTGNGTYVKNPHQEEWIWVSVAENPYTLSLEHIPYDTDPTTDSTGTSSESTGTTTNLTGTTTDSTGPTTESTGPTTESTDPMLSLNTDKGRKEFKTEAEVELFQQSGLERITDEDMLQQLYQYLRKHHPNEFHQVINGFLDHNDRFKTLFQTIIQHLVTTLSNFQQHMTDNPDEYIENKVNTFTPDEQLAIDAKKDLLRLKEPVESKISLENREFTRKNLFSNTLITGKGLTTQSTNDVIINVLSPFVNENLPESFRSLAGFGTVSDFEKLEKKLKQDYRPIADSIVSLASAKLMQLQKEFEEREKNENQRKETRREIDKIINKFLLANTPRLSQKDLSEKLKQMKLSDAEEEIIRKNPQTFLELFTKKIGQGQIDEAYKLFKLTHDLFSNPSLVYWFQTDKVASDAFIFKVHSVHPEIFQKKRKKRTEQDIIDANFLSTLKDIYPKLYRIFYETEPQNDDPVFYERYNEIGRCKDEARQNWNSCLTAVTPLQNGGRSLRKKTGKKKRHTKHSKKKTARRRRH
jgi:hypothetical protein